MFSVSPGIFFAVINKSLVILKISFNTTEAESGKSMYMLPRFSAKFSCVNFFLHQALLLIQISIFSKRFSSDFSPTKSSWSFSNENVFRMMFLFWKIVCYSKNCCYDLLLAGLVIDYKKKITTLLKQC